VTTSRLSRLQRRILAWLAQEAQRTCGTMSASHQDLVYTMAADKGNLSRSLANLEAKGLITISRSLGGKAEAVDLTPAGRREVVNQERIPWPSISYRSTPPTMSPSTCIAYQEDGSLCRAPASILDHQRGGMVCLQHLPLDVAEEITLYQKMGTVEGRIENDGEVYSWRLYVKHGDVPQERREET